MTLAVAAAAVVLAGLVAVNAIGLQKAVIVFAACAFTVVPIELVGFGVGSTLSHTTIAVGRVSVSTHDVAIVLAAALSGLSIWRHVRIEFLLVAAGSLAIAVSASDLKPWVAEGILQWVFLAFCWALGAAIADRVRHGELSERFIAGVLLTCVGLHALASFAQLFGFGTVYQSDVGDGALARMTGLAGHPGNLGKIVLLLSIIILPLTSSKDQIARRISWIALILALGTIGVTFSRANVAAAGVLIVGWFVLRRGKAGLTRVTIPIVTAIAAIPVIQILLERQRFDPEGGLRPQLMRSAMIQLRETFWWGVGPNDYIETVGQFDPYAVGGLPVHSSFMLLLVELGAVVSIAAVLPFLFLLSRGVRKFLENRHQYATALLLATPGLVLVLATGHGMTSRVVAPTFFLVIGYLWVAMTGPPESVATEKVADEEHRSAPTRGRLSRHNRSATGTSLQRDRLTSTAGGVSRG